MLIYQDTGAGLVAILLPFGIHPEGLQTTGIFLLIPLSGILIL
jgi:hypothetical protein